MKLILNIFLLLTVFLSLSACSTAMVATSSAGNSLNLQGRSFATNSTDQAITYTVMKDIYKDSELYDRSRIVAVTFERNVLLVGQAPTVAMKQKAEQIVHSIPKVRGIYNDITIGQPINTYQQGNDGLITANIKSRMFTTTNLRGRNIKVVTENGTVYLMGAVSREEGGIAAEVARNSSGVKKVVKLFEYTG